MATTPTQNPIGPVAAPATVIPKLTTSLSGFVTSEIYPNFATDTGTSNALVITLNDNTGTAIPLVAGLSILVKTANTLQNGANTLTFNGTSKAIKNQNLNNVSTPFVVGALINFAYDGTQWQLLGQGG